MRIKKRNTSGNARNFITRTQAVRKLQLSLADFRRLCIFKGIYPREPRNKKKANKGSTAPTTFYYFRDIQYLMHEPILHKFREHKTFVKKLTKYLGKGQVSAASKLETEQRKLHYNLDHVIKERYPSFPEAIRDIDDALNMLFLFSNLPATDRVSAKITKEATKLTNEWLAFVSRERLIRKVFVSIKGVYYSANVRGEEVRWIVPYKFPENIPSDVDFRIMLTFLEFYSTLLHFVLYKLYHDAGLVYPPKLDLNKEKLIGGLSSYVLETQEESQKSGIDANNSEVGATVDNEALAKALAADKQTTDAIDEAEITEENELEENETGLDTFEDNNKNKGDVLEQPKMFDSPQAVLFNNFVFFIGREVPIDIVQFLILSCGGKVISEIEIDQLKTKPDLSQITHHIVDRPTLKNRVAGRTYIQPQWVFDSVNKGELVAANLYLPGETLPPHLSPWGDSLGYDPTAEETKDQDDEEDGEEEDEEVEEEEEVVVAEGDEDQEEDEVYDDEVLAQKELEMESKGVSYTEGKDQLPAEKRTNKKRKADTADEEKDLKLIMMTNKQRKLYKTMQYSNNQKEDKINQLKKKKKEIEKKKKQLNKMK